MNKLFKNLLLSLLPMLMVTYPALALNELDVPELGSAAVYEIEQLLKENNISFGSNLHEADEKQQQSDGNEGKHLFWDKVKKTAIKSAENAGKAALEQAKSGNFNFQDMAGSIAEGAMPDISQFSPSDLLNLVKKKKGAKKDLEEAKEELKSIEDAELQERNDKIKAIRSELLECETALAALPPESPTRITLEPRAVQLRMELEDLEANEDSTVEETNTEGNNQTATDLSVGEGQAPEPKKESTMEKLKKKKNAIAKKYEKAKAKAMEKIAKAQEEYENFTKVLDTSAKFQEMQKKTDEYMNKIFGEQEEEEVEDIYAQVIADFFLDEDEIINSENITRVAKKRKQAYYYALQDLFVTATQGDGTSLQTREEADTARETMTEEADTNFGAKNMQMSVEFQIIRSSAQLTKMLLAKLKMDSLQHIQSWTNFYKLNDYSQDFTSFNLDNYKFDPSLKGKLKSKGKSLLNKYKNKAKNAAKSAVQKSQGVVDSAVKKAVGDDK